MQQIQYGIVCIFRSAKIIFCHRILWKYIIATWLITSFFFALCFTAYAVLGAVYIPPNAPSWENQVPEPFKEKFLSFLIIIIRKDENEVKDKIMEHTAYVFGIGLAFLTALVSQSFFNKPLNDKISKHVEKIISGRVVQIKAPPFSQGFKERIKETFFYFWIFWIFFAISFISYLWITLLLYSAFLIGKAYCEYVLDRRPSSYQIKKKKIKKNFLLVLTLGIFFGIFLLIPGMNVFLITLNIVAGTIATVERIDVRSGVGEKRKKANTYSHPHPGWDADFS